VKIQTGSVRIALERNGRTRPPDGFTNPRVTHASPDAPLMQEPHSCRFLLPVRRAGTRRCPCSLSRVGHTGSRRCGSTARGRASTPGGRLRRQSQYVNPQMGRYSRRSGSTTTASGARAATSTKSRGGATSTFSPASACSRWAGVLGGENYTPQHLLAATTGLPEAKLRVPLALSIGAAHVSELLEGRVMRRHPLIPLEAARMSTTQMAFDDSRARKELGWAPRPADEAVLASADGLSRTVTSKRLDAPGSDGLPVEDCDNEATGGAARRATRPRDHSCLRTPDPWRQRPCEDGLRKWRTNAGQRSRSPDIFQRAASSSGRAGDF
jgi:hypothetical protein